MAATQGSTLFLSVVCGRLLGVERFGEFTLVLITVNTLSNLAQFGLGYTATRLVSEYRTLHAERAAKIIALGRRVSFVLGILAGLLSYLASGYLARVVLGVPTLAGAMAATSGAIACNVVVSFATGALAGLEEYRRIAAAAAIYSIVFIGVTTGAALYFGVTGVALALSVTALLRLAIFEWALIRASRAHGVQLGHGNWGDEWRAMMDFAAPASLGGLSTLIAGWSVNALIARSDSSLREVGLLGAAMTVRNAILFLPGLVDALGLAVLNAQYGRGDREGYKAVFRSLILWNTSIAGLLALATGFLATPLLATFGHGFEQGRQVLTVLALSTIPQVIASGVYQIVQTRRRLWLSVWIISLPRDLLLVSVTVVLLNCGAKAAAWGYLGAQLLQMLSTIGVVRYLWLDTTSVKGG